MAEDAPRDPKQLIAASGQAAQNERYEEAQAYLDRARELTSGPRPPEIQDILQVDITRSEILIGFWKAAHVNQTRSGWVPGTNQQIDNLHAAAEDFEALLPTLSVQLDQSDISNDARIGLEAVRGRIWANAARAWALGAVAYRRANMRNSDQSIFENNAAVGFLKADKALRDGHDWLSYLENALHGRRFAQLYGNFLSAPVWRFAVFRARSAVRRHADELSDEQMNHARQLSVDLAPFAARDIGNWLLLYTMQP